MAAGSVAVLFVAFIDLILNPSGFVTVYISLAIQVAVEPIAFFTGESLQQKRASERVCVNKSIRVWASV